MQDLLVAMINKVISTLGHNWFPLTLAILIAALMSVYIDPEKLKQSLKKRTNMSLLGSVGLGAFTPLCACGTMTVIISMLTTTLPWGPVMAFLTSSPLMSPEGFVMLSGIISVNFAVALTLASVIIGLGSGYVTHLIEKKTNFLKNQVRFVKKQTTETCGCSGTKPVPTPEPLCGCAKPAPVKPQLCCVTALDGGGQLSGQSFDPMVSGQLPALNVVSNLIEFVQKFKWRETAAALWNIGVKQILLFFSVFVAVGFLINRFVPASLIVALFSGDKFYAVPLAALVGFPIYISGESSIPLIQSLMAGGAGGGAMLAFMITGPGTSAWVVAGIATFLKRRVIGLYIFFLLVGGIVLGYLYDLFLRLF